MSIDKMINMLLIKLSNKHSVFYMEKRTYNEGRINKCYYIKIDDFKKEYRSKMELLKYLSTLKE